jgi:hypothetical protein
MCLSLTQYLSVADNARDAVLLHVSASSERQEFRNETDAVTSVTECHILTNNAACGHYVLCFYSVQYLVLQVTSIIRHTHDNSTILSVTFYFVAEYHITTNIVNVITIHLSFHVKQNIRLGN